MRGVFTPQHLFVPLDGSLVAVIPIGIPKEDYVAILKTLRLWKRRIIKKPAEPAIDYQI